MDFVPVTAGDEDRIGTARELFLEYQRELGIDLCFQGFEEEVKSIPGKYAPPAGRLVLVYGNAGPIACGALRHLGEGVCELKRIYVRPAARRQGLARTISEHLIEFGRTAGYHTARLDTMKRMTGAIELYEQLGFRYTEPYNFSPELDIVYMELPL